MKKRTLTLLVVTAIAVIAVAATLSIFLFGANQKVEIPYDATLTVSKGSSGAYLSMHLLPEKTLFNCQVTLTYTATNGTSVTITQKIGIVDTNPRSQSADFELTDYSTGTVSAQTQFTQTNPPSTLGISVYGYPSP